ncbi:E3 ubiquitin ligase family protein [Natribaculum luteum]|uniref:RING-type E3 ubiquitin transferase n=1 Tax=Natribaculum luteum TaxID=1586232 RepID=A0ABD5P035_9EURY|nr:E3 ubiquitin ligase family protein [Natribaculum luteum]
MVESFVISLSSLVFVVVGLITVNKGRAERAKSTRMEETETTAIRDLEPGPVEVKGTVRGTDDATFQQSPIDGTEELAVHVEVKELHSDGNGPGNWQTIFEDQTAEPMFIDDGTSEVLVDLPEDGGLNLEQTEWKVEAGDDPPEKIRTYVGNEPALDLPDGIDIGPLSTGERRRYLEGTLEPGEDVYLLGTARETEAGWDNHKYVIDEPTPDGDFILSDKSEATLIEEERSSGLVLLAAGILMTVIGLTGVVSPFLSI